MDSVKVTLMMHNIWFCLFENCVFLSVWLIFIPCEILYCSIFIAKRRFDNLKHFEYALEISVLSDIDDGREGESMCMREGTSEKKRGERERIRG